jgi:hypothetical protein
LGDREGIGLDTTIAREPERNGKLAAFAGKRRQITVIGEIQRGLVEVRRDFVMAEAKTAMCVTVAQGFFGMRREIDEKQPPARAQHARGFTEGAAGIVEIM